MATFAVTNFAELRYAIETSLGVAPVDAKTIRYTGHSVGKKSNYATSTEIRADRQVADAMRLGSTVDGDVNFEFSADSYDDMLYGLLMEGSGSTWSDASNDYDVSPADAGGLSVVVGTREITGGLDFEAVNGGVEFVPGRWVRVEDNVNGVWVARISSVNTTTLGFTNNSIEVQAAGAGEVTSFTALRNIRNGGLSPSEYVTFTFEDERTDVIDESSNENVRFVFRGMKVSSMSLAISSQAIITGSFNVMGTDMDIIASDADSPFTGIVTPSDDSVPMTATTNVSSVFQDGQVMNQCKFKSINLTVNNNARAQDAVGCEFPVDIAIGQFNATFSAQAYFASKEMYEKFVYDQYTSVAFALTGRDNNGDSATYIFDFPRVKITSAGAMPGGLDQDQMVDLEMQALKDFDLGYTMQVSKYIS